MKTEKEIKREFKLKAQKNAEKYYPVRVLKERGFKRQQCKNCGTFFWSIEEREVCGDAACIGKYEFIGNSPAKRKLGYIQVWKEFAKLFERFGYKPIKRYPVVARWREDAYFVQASIYDFQPYCVRGEVEPPANPLVVPQFCLRFNDIDNVGITGRHFTGFVMIGQHAFERKNYNPELYLEHIYAWLTEVMKIPEEKIQFHEDAWAGGGNLGPSMEFFSGGLEIGNQVYMQYEISGDSIKELDIKVLDMGMGQERPAWLTQATSTSYEAVFGNVMEKLYRKAGIKIDREFLKEFLPLSGILNFEEEDYNKSMQRIAKAMKASIEEIESKIIPLSRLYSVTEHARSLLVAISDGALPSNVGGGYNLRTILRRALNFIEIENWDLSLYEVCEMHAHYLKEQFPELIENLDELREILEVEEKRYRETKEKSRRIIISLKERKEKLTPEKLFELYDSHGISPEILKQSGISIALPGDFYAKISEMHEQKRKKASMLSKAGEEIEIEKLNGRIKNIDTVKLYYLDSELFEFDAKIIRSINNYVVLDRTAFYPIGGGQEYDTGIIKSSDGKKEAKVIAVYKKENAVLHKLDKNPFSEGEVVNCMVNEKRRKQLTKHHTATHIINGSARAMLGEHIWQSGAEKTEEKARLDITHYENLSLEQIEKLEELANSIVERGEKIEAEFYSRDEAEKKFGFRIYQGGAVPGKVLRIVRIGNDIDTEACGGTHLKNTREAEIIRIISSTRIQDGIIRLEFCAGEACINFIENEINILKKIKENAERVIKVKEDLISPAENELEKQKKERVVNKNRLKIFQRVSGEIKACCNAFSVSKSEIERTIAKFVDEVLSLAEENKKLRGNAWKEIVKGEESSLSEACKRIFEIWKRMLKENEKLKKRRISEKAEKEFMEIGKLKFAFLRAEKIAKEFSDIARSFSQTCDAFIMLSKEDRGIAFAISTRTLDARKILDLIRAELNVKGGGKKDFVQGFIFDYELEEAYERIKKALKTKL